MNGYRIINETGEGITLEEIEASIAKLQSILDYKRAIAKPEVVQSDGTPIIAWRSYTAQMGYDWGVELKGSAHNVWSGRSFQAVCSFGGNVDEHLQMGACTCGIYALDEIPEVTLARTPVKPPDPEALVNLEDYSVRVSGLFNGSGAIGTMIGGWSTSVNTIVYAECVLFGTVLEGDERGYRATNARIERLWLMPLDFRKKNLVKGLEEKYQVPVGELKPDDVEEEAVSNRSGT